MRIIVIVITLSLINNESNNSTFLAHPQATQSSRVTLICYLIYGYDCLFVIMFEQVGEYYNWTKNPLVLLRGLWFLDAESERFELSQPL